MFRSLLVNLQWSQNHLAFVLLLAKPTPKSIKGNFMFRILILNLLISSTSFALTLPDYFPMESLNLVGRTIEAKQDVLIPGNGFTLFAQSGQIYSSEVSGEKCAFQAEPEDSPAITAIRANTVYSIVEYSVGKESKVFRVTKPNCHRGHDCDTTEVYYRSVMHMFISDSEGHKFDIDCMTGYDASSASVVTPLLLKRQLAPFFTIENMLTID